MAKMSFSTMTLPLSCATTASTMPNPKQKVSHATPNHLALPVRAKPTNRITREMQVLPARPKGIIILPSRMEQCSRYMPMTATAICSRIMAHQDLTSIRTVNNKPAPNPNNTEKINHRLREYSQ